MKTIEIQDVEAAPRRRSPGRLCRGFARLRHRIGPERSQRGAVAVEFALIAPVLVLLTFGTIEFSSAYHDKSIAADAARAAARVGSAKALQTDFASAAAASASSAVRTLPAGDPQELWIYKANSQGYPGGGSSFSSCSANCIKYTYSQGSRSFVQSGGGGWTAANQQVCTQPYDEIGVYVKLKHPFVTGLFGAALTLTDHAVFRFEPGRDVAVQLMRRHLHLQVRKDDERGMVAVWVALTMIVMLGFAGWAIDFAHWNDERANLQKAADAAALAGAVYLPDDPAGAIAAAKSIAAKNGYSSGVSVTTLQNANQLKVTVSTNVKSSFAQAVGIGSANLARQAVSEYESPQPLDFVLILDRTGSMCGVSPCPKPPPANTPLDQVKAATIAVLGYLNPKNESIALGTLGPSYTNQTCPGVPGAYGAYSNNDDGSAANTTWMIAPFPNATPTNDYQTSTGAVNPNSQIVKTVNCLQFGGSTDLGDPIAAATTYLQKYGRPGARKGIILMTDGAANLPLPTNPQPCQYADDKATAAKAAGIQVLTIGFLGLADKTGTTCVRDTAKTSKFVNGSVQNLLASMASPIKGVPAVNNGCTDAENTDGDNFFCQPKGGDIKKVFLAAVAQLANRLPRIVQ